MGIHIPTLLEGILEATAAEAAAAARITSLRAALEAEGRRRLEVDGAAPSWNTPKLGKVRLDPYGEWLPLVHDANAFGSYVAEHYPTEATATLVINSADLGDALKALGFVGVPVAESRVEVRPSWQGTYLDGLVVDVEEPADEATERVITIAETDTGAVVPGLTASRKPPKIVVTLDRDRRTAAITQARATADALIEAASEDDDTTPVDLQELDLRRRNLEALPAEELSAIAKAHDLGASGTKASLAERIARSELATGRYIRTASELPVGPVGLRDREQEEAEQLARMASADLGPGSYQLAAEAAVLLGTPGPLPEGTEVEEVTTLPTQEPDLDHPVEEVPDGGAVADSSPAYDDDRPGLMRVHVAQERARELDEAASREVLRKLAKRRSISAAGTKAEVIGRLVAAGVTAADLRT